MRNDTKILKGIQEINVTLSKMDLKIHSLERELIAQKLVIVDSQVMSNQSPRKQAFLTVKSLRSQGQSYSQIIKEIQRLYSIKLSLSTLSDWLSGNHKPQ